MPDLLSTCTDCGEPVEGGIPHGAPGDRSVAGLLCSLTVVQDLLTGDHPEALGEPDTDYCADLIGQALARFRGEPYLPLRSPADLDDLGGVEGHYPW